MKTLSDICPCGENNDMAYRLDQHGVWWYWCGTCGWWHLSDWYERT
jgi:hypothetical protein